MDSEQRRKRKRFIRGQAAAFLPSHFFTVRSLILCFSFITFLFLLSYQIRINSSAFRPVLVVSSISLLSSSSSSSGSSISYFDENLSLPFKIEDRVLFPDHELLLVSKGDDRNGWMEKWKDLECVYHQSHRDKHSNDTSDSAVIVGSARSVLSVDDYDEFRAVVRCASPPRNFTAVVDLRWRRGRDVAGFGGDKGLWRINRTVFSWENVAYASTLDRETAVVFVKGLNLRSDRKSDPTQFSCHFGLGNRQRHGRFALTTKAIAAAQEVVRCLLPQSIRKNPNKALGVRVTIGVTNLDVHSKAHKLVLMPSVAKISNSRLVEEKNSYYNPKKYELCVCTMVWNQASALREWITYHAWLGVGRWFIYDNNSDDGIKKLIKVLELEGYNVSRHVWPWIKTQEAGFSHCAVRARNECNWVSFMDVDEYFYFPFPTFRRQRNMNFGFPGRNSLQALIANFSASPAVAEIRTSCHSFGPSGLSSPPLQGVTVGYTCRLQSPERHKSIVRPDALDITLLNVIHHFHLKKGFKYINLPQSTAVINHYKYQVWEIFRAKFFRRVATYVADWKENQNEGSKDRAPGLGTEAIEPPNWRLQFCEVWDTGLRDFVLANLVLPATGLLPWERSL